MEQSSIRGWLQDPVTQVFFKSLIKRRAALLEMIATGQTLNSNDVVKELARAVGSINLIDEITSAALIRDEKLEE